MKKRTRQTSDLKKEITTPTLGRCKIEDVQKYHSNELINMTDLMRAVKENRLLLLVLLWHKMSFIKLPCQ